MKIDSLGDQEKNLFIKIDKLFFTKYFSGYLLSLAYVKRNVRKKTFSPTCVINT